MRYTIFYVEPISDLMGQARKKKASKTYQVVMREQEG